MFPENMVAVPPNPNQPHADSVLQKNPYLSAVLAATEAAKQAAAQATQYKMPRSTKPPKQQYSTPSPLSVSVASVIIGDQNVEHSSDSTYVPVPIPVFETEPALNVQSDSYHEAPKQQIKPRLGSGRPAYPLVEHPEIMIEPPNLQPEQPNIEQSYLLTREYPPYAISTPPNVIKESYEINYCDGKEFTPERLADYGLEKIDYFVYNKSCSKIFFQCAIGQTFILKCPSDDQAFDPSTVNCNFRNSIKFCPEYDHIMHCTIKETCTSNQFACCAHPQQCLDLQRRCDGNADCSDGEDENNCPSCARDEFACVKSGRCIPSSQRCDEHEDDCGDGSNLDETGCTKNTTCWGKFVCDSRETLNLLGRSDCIDYERHCDGYKDCPGGEDEINCRLTDAKYLLCENQKQSVRKDQWCDGVDQCADGSDEKYCYMQ
uniref:Chitin-binding type-2 domain-containing protein n=1 Tax=Acrobeloides nanus TaxID=290746 RepID=A0A914DP20_9BILA